VPFFLRKNGVQTSPSLYTYRRTALWPHLVDLGGLTDSSFLPYLRQHQIFAYLEDRNIQYLVWPTAGNGELALAQIVVFTPEQRRDMTGDGEILRTA
jgi:hypothetical protein